MRKEILIGSGLAVAVFGVTSGLISAKDAAIASLFAVPSALTAHIITDAKAQKRINELDSKLSKAVNRAESADICESMRTQLQTELNKTRDALEIALQEHKKAHDLSEYLQKALTTLEAQQAVSAEEIQELKYNLEDWEAEFADRVNTEAEHRFQIARKNEILKIFDAHDAVTSEARAITEELQNWAVKVSKRFVEKEEGIQDFKALSRGHLKEYIDLTVTERDNYLRVIDQSNEKIAMLQQQLAGDLVEPEYGQFGFDQNGRIANAIAEWLWNHHKIPLKVTGFEIGTDGTITTGFTYPRSMPLEALSSQIEKDSSIIARSLGLYSVEKAQKLQIADVLTVKIRRERPARKADKGSLYRSKEEFVKFLLSQPVRLRIVGEPGSGKTPTVAVLLGHILSRGFLEANTPNGRKLPYCVVESCNPLAGISVKNGDELDFCLKWNSGAKGFKGLAEEYRFRKNPTNAEYKNSVGYVWVADEIDVTMADLTKDEAKPFKDALKDGGHINLGVIVMGQSANVSTSKGLSIDDQKMLTNIYIDPVSIRTFLTQYGERFYSKRAVEKALATLEELELEIEEKNEVICDTAREFRVAMVTASRSPVFYQLPYFDSVEIDTNSYQQTLVKVSVIRDGRGGTPSDAPVPPNSENACTASVTEGRDTSGHSPYAGLGTRPDTSVKPTCPHCGSDSIRSKGDKWLCLNPEHSMVASGTPKSWKK